MTTMIVDGVAGTRAERTDHLVRLLPGSSGARRREVVEQLILVNLEVAESVAGRYRGRGIPDDDLCQVARTALVRAAQQYDAEAGHDFLAYAVPTMRGALRRHFRDLGWVVRPPRRIQELVPEVRTAAATLRASRGGEPTATQIAELLRCAVAEVVEVLACDGCYSPASLDRPVRQEDDAPTVGDALPSLDDPTAAAEARVVLEPAVRRLGARDRRILQLRFVDEWTQREIAADIGVSQVQVSRLLGRIVDRLRQDLGVPLTPAP